MSKGDQFITKFLGGDFWETLEKSNELFKLKSQVALNPEEIRIGLKVAPRFVMSFLVRELVPIAIGDQKTIQLPFGVNAHMNVNKGDADDYSGSIISDNKPAYDFRNRSIPGIGIILLSTFELYDMLEMDREEKHTPEMADSVQKLIDERMQQRLLIEQVVDQKLSEREAIHKIVMQKLAEALKAPESAAPPYPGAEHFPGAEIPVMPAPKEEIEFKPSDMIKKEKSKKGSPLKEFLDRKRPKEFPVQMEKSETVNCPDCQQVIFGDTGYSGCICMGMDQHRKVWLKKTEDGVSIRFSRGWDQENMEMLLDVLRRKNG